MGGYRFNPLVKKGFDYYRKEAFGSGEVNIYADLPPAADHAGEYWAVLNSTGLGYVWGTRKGFYRSDGISWTRMSNTTLKAEYADFLIGSPDPTHQEGRLFYSNSKKCHSSFNDRSDVSMQLGRELWRRAENDTGVTITNGTLVYITGWGTNNPTVGLASNTIKGNAEGVIGMVTEDIQDVAVDILGGEVTRFGEVGGIDTSLETSGSIVYLGTDGNWTTTRPTSPDYVVRIGVIGEVGVSGSILVDIVGFNSSDTSVNEDGWLNGIIIDKQDIIFTVDGGVVYAEMNNSVNPTKDLPFILDGDRYLLNTTTSTGTDGRARIALTSGTINDSQVNFLYIYLNGDVPTFGASTTFPIIDFCWAGIVGLLDVASTTADGVFAWQRTNNSVNNGVGDGSHNYVTERIRQAGAVYSTGVDPTVTILSLPNPDSVKVSFSGGFAWQLHHQSVDAQDGNTYYWVNHPTEPFKKISDLNEINVYADGSPIANNDRYGLNLFIHQASEGGVDKVLVTCPDGGYGVDDGAINDTFNYAVTYLPSGAGINTNSFRVCRLALRYQSANSGTYTNLLGAGGFQNERGLPLGQGGSGSGAFSYFGLEVQNSGVHSMTGTITANGASPTTDVDVPAGSGLIVDSFTEPAAPSGTQVDWVATTITVNGIGTNLVSTIYVDNNDVIQSVGGFLTSEQRRNNVILGYTINDYDAGAIEEIVNMPIVSNNIGSTLYDYMFGDFNSREGAIPSANGGNLKLDVGAATYRYPGINWHTNKKIPNEKNVSSATQITFTYLLQDGGIDSLREDVTDVDPNVWESVPGTLSTIANPNNATIQELWVIPFTSTPTYFILHGQDVYTNIFAAYDSLQAHRDTVVVPSDLESIGLRIGYIIADKATIDLDSSAFIVPVSSASGGGGAPVEAQQYFLNVVGAEYSYVNASTVSLGTTGEISKIVDDTDTYIIQFSDTISASFGNPNGAGGLDTGTEAANTLYHVWAIGDSTGANTPAVLISASATTPTLPAGYDIKRRMGAFRNNASSNIIEFTCSGKTERRYYKYHCQTNETSVLSGGSATIWTTVNCGAFIPAGVRGEIMTNIFYLQGSAGSGLYVREAGTGTDGDIDIYRPSYTSIYQDILNHGGFTCNISQQFEYYVFNGTDIASIRISGYSYDLNQMV